MKELLKLFFFENDRGNAVIVNRERFRKILSKSFASQFEDISLEKMWFPQDGVTCRAPHGASTVLYKPLRVLTFPVFETKIGRRDFTTMVFVCGAL